MASTSVKEVRRVREAVATHFGATRQSVPESPVAFASECLGFTLDDWQTEVLEEDNPRKILLAGRQVGKSTLGGILACHKALSSPGSTVLLTAPSERQSKLLMRKVSQFYRMAGYPLAASSERKTGLELSNGSIVEAVPAVERTTRGYSVDLLIVDEAAAVPDADYFAILPALIATRGEQLILSTARGKRGFYFETYTSASEAGWYEKTIRSDQVPDRIHAEDLEAFRKSMPAEFFEQEFLCRFLDTEGSLFSYEDIHAALEAGENIEAIKDDDIW